MRLAGTLFAAAALGCAAPLSAEVAETTASGFVTRDMAEVAATPMQTWLALIRPGAWWNDAHTWSADAANMTLTPQAGGCLCERVPGEDRADGFSLDGSVQHMVVVQAYPLKNLRMRGGLGPLQGEPATGVLTITLEEIDGGTIRATYFSMLHRRRLKRQASKTRSTRWTGRGRRRARSGTPRGGRRSCLSKGFDVWRPMG